MVNCALLSQDEINKSNYNILIVEDSKPINKILFKKFFKSGFNCESVFTLTDAYKHLETNDVDYLILDINLPDGNGFDLIKKLENTPEKIFVLTSDTDKHFRDIAYQKGVIDFINKDKNFLDRIPQIITTIEQLEKNKLKTVLVIDDSIIIQKQLTDLLENRHYNVEVASNREVALGFIENKNIDLILLDVELEDDNGIDFLQENNNLIINQRKIPVLIISGNIEASTIRNGLKAGAVDVLKKPYIIEEIVLKVDLWIDYKRKEEEILCSNQILNEYKDTVDESSIVSKANPKGIITYVNNKFCELSGFTREELIGKNHNIVRHPDTSKETFQDVWNTIKNLKKSWNGKIKNRKKDGGYYWVEAHIKPILDLNGNIVEFIGLRNDITEFEDQKKYLKYNLESSNYMLHQYQDGIENSSSIARLDLELNIIYVNDRYTTLSKYSKDELEGACIVDFVAEESLYLMPELLDVIKKGEVYQGVFQGKPKSGQPYYTKSTIKPLKNINGEVIEYLVIKTDITDEINLQKEIEDTQKEVVFTMGAIGETRSKETGDHVKRVADYSYLLAKLAGLDEDDANILKMASPMHDIGKVGIPDNILNKPGKLTSEEFEIIKTHSTLGYEMLKNSNREILKTSAIVAHEHHEKWDGTGYPRGLCGEDIHIYGRITSIVDVFDALGHSRCYKKAWELDRIYDLFMQEKGIHFDPNLIDLFFENKEKFLEIKANYDG